MIQIVLDTNVLVSGLLSPLNAPGRIIDALQIERIQLAIDDRIFLEYGEVLRRPKFERYIQPDDRPGCRHGIDVGLTFDNPTAGRHNR